MPFVEIDFGELRSLTLTVQAGKMAGMPYSLDVSNHHLTSLQYILLITPSICPNNIIIPPIFPGMADFQHKDVHKNFFFFNQHLSQQYRFSLISFIL